MGLPMAHHVRDAGFDVTAYDIAADAITEKEKAGLTIAASAAEVAKRCTVVFVVVPTDEDTLAAVSGDDGLFGTAQPGTLVAICSSVRPDTVRRVQELAAELAAGAGVRILDMPLTKGIRGAVAGTMTLLVGGDKTDLAEIRPVLECFSTAVHHVGDIGAGQIAKTINNILLWSNLAAAEEALGLAATLGLEPAKLRDALLDCSADSWVLREFEQVKPVWPAKDMANALKIASQAGAAMPLATRVAECVNAIDEAALHRLIPPPGPAHEDEPDR